MTTGSELANALISGLSPSPSNYITGYVFTDTANALNVYAFYRGPSLELRIMLFETSLNLITTISVGTYGYNGAKGSMSHDSKDNIYIGFSDTSGSSRSLLKILPNLTSIFWHLSFSANEGVYKTHQIDLTDDKLYYLNFKAGSSDSFFLTKLNSSTVSSDWSKNYQEGINGNYFIQFYKSYVIILKPNGNLVSNFVENFS